MNNEAKEKKSCCGKSENHSCGKKETKIENFRSDQNTEINKKLEETIDQAKEKKGKEEKAHLVVGVLFEVTRKRYFFETKERVNYKKGEKVLVETARGVKIGVVFMEPKKVATRQLVLPLKPILKKASVKEEELYEKFKEDAKRAFGICKKEIGRLKLAMKLVATEYTIDKKKLIFYFTADDRIDFRELVKSLASQFKLRIELRQIGVRDEARILGDVGVCGRELCCRTFIDKFDSVSIKMARDQGLVINPAKISGVCGRLLCCIKYENKQYIEELKKFPANQQRVETVEGPGRVTSVNPLNGYMYIDVQGKGIMKMGLEDLVAFKPKGAPKGQEKRSKEERELKKLEKN